ncbi:hypothetical protein SCOCK_630031 [Actinacidiphila cocklensis]|uniref:Uncharacterized protein n=1 Tax=Actinacidiphila cocklensis TaxID=887465 RepID=A0A9W4EB16_9ACTN|nr:hypothetical protein SCOCK_630031 [Actinacidiphila cocklensis]
MLSHATNKTVSYYNGADCTSFTGNLGPGRAAAYQSPLSAE